MSHISIHREHSIPMQDLRNRIDTMIVKIQQNLDVRAEWISDSQLTFRRKGANGSIEIDPNNFSLELNLGLMFRMMQGSISQQINLAVDSQFN